MKKAVSVAFASLSVLILLFSVTARSLATAPGSHDLPEQLGLVTSEEMTEESWGEYAIGLLPGETVPRFSGKTPSGQPVTTQGLKGHRYVMCLTGANPEGYLAVKYWATRLPNVLFLVCLDGSDVPKEARVLERPANVRLVSYQPNMRSLFKTEKPLWFLVNENGVVVHQFGMDPTRWHEIDRAMGSFASTGRVPDDTPLTMGVSMRTPMPPMPDLVGLDGVPQTLPENGRPTLICYLSPKDEPCQIATRVATTVADEWRESIDVVLVHSPYMSAHEKAYQEYCKALNLPLESRTPEDLEELAVAFRDLSPNIQVLLDPSRSVDGRWGYPSMPSFILLDANGVVAGKWAMAVGYGEGLLDGGEVLAANIASLVGQRTFDSR